MHTRHGASSTTSPQLRGLSERNVTDAELARLEQAVLLDQPHTHYDGNFFGKNTDHPTKLTAVKMLQNVDTFPALSLTPPFAHFRTR